MPSASAADFRRAAAHLGFEQRRKTGSHERWIHPDGRAVTIPIHGGGEIGPPGAVEKQRRPASDQLSDPTPSADSGSPGQTRT